MKTKENQRGGISLIVLVITIIVIIILAAAVMLSLNNNNPITNAKKATVQSDLKTYTDELSLYVANKYTETMGAFNPNEINAQAEAMNTYISSMQEKYHNIVEIELGKLVIREGVTGDEKLWAEEILGYGKIGKVMESNMTINGLTTGTATNPIIPKGFAPINTDTSIWGDINGVNGGLVIEDKTGDVNTNGNQFVWIPVPVFERFVRTDDYKQAGGRTASECNEAFGDGTSNSTEAEKMYKSVNDNGGFYISRFEAGKPSGATVPVSKTKQPIWNYIVCGTSNDDISPGAGAVTLSRSVYPESETNVGATSTLIYGVQWDATMKYMETSGEKTGDLLKDSTTWGNHASGILKDAGSSETWKSNNIYDFAGNVWEWTMEKISSNRIVRSGVYNESGSFKPVSYRGSYTASISHSGDEGGFRFSLYIT